MSRTYNRCGEPVVLLRLFPHRAYEPPVSSSGETEDGDPKHALIDRGLNGEHPRPAHDVSCDGEKQCAADGTGFVFIRAQWSRGEWSTPRNNNTHGETSETDGGRHDC